METVSPSTATTVPFTVGFQGASGGQDGGANGQKPEGASSANQLPPLNVTSDTSVQAHELRMAQVTPGLAVLFTRTEALQP